MPWIDKGLCTGCGTCVGECPVEAIALIGDIAEINMDNCIRCGICHQICPQDAVRHDSELIPGLVEDNINTTKKYMAECQRYLPGNDQDQKCLSRMIKHFNKERIIAEKTLAALNQLKST